MKNCKNCINATEPEQIKSGKYYNDVYRCKVKPTVMFLGYWKKTEAINCKDFKEV